MSKRKHERTERSKRRSKKSAAPKRSKVYVSGMRDPRVLVERIMSEPDPKKRWQMEQALAMDEAVRVAKIEGERQARMDRELGLGAPSERIGAGEFVDILQQDKQRKGG
jgi:hypothetical protein